MTFHRLRPPAPRRALLAAATLVASMATLLPASVRAAPAINTLKPGLIGGRGELAIQGYDPVAYFTEARPVKGLDSHAHTWMGATWTFASREHLELFKAHPERYAPQYGGYCAYGTARGYLVKIDPAQFRIVDGKLYLNYDADVQALWLKDVPGFIRAADAKYPNLIRE